MTKEPPERLSISIPPDSDLSADDLDELVEQSEYGSRSEFIRAAIRGKADIKQLDPTE